MKSMPDDDVVDLLRGHDRRLLVPGYVGLARVRRRDVRRLAFAGVTLAAALLVVVSAGLVLRGRAETSAGSTGQPSLVATAPAASGTFGFLVSRNADEIGARSEQSDAPLRTFHTRTYAVSPDGRSVAYWQTGADDALPHVLHVLDLPSGSDKTVLTLDSERAGAAGWMVWASNGSSLAFAVHSADSAFEGRLAPRVPAASSVRILDLGSGTTREAMHATNQWLAPMAWNPAKNQVVAIGRGSDDQLLGYLVRDLNEPSARALPLPVGISAASVVADWSGDRVLGIARSACPIGTCGAVWVWPATEPSAPARASSSDVNALSALFRPGSNEVYAIVRDASNASAIQRWSEAGGAPAQIARMPALGRLLFRVDGSALIATQTDLNRSVAYLIDPVSTRMAQITVTDDPLAGVVVR